jgi:transcriptional regulator with XRE-family HTH domain
MITPYQLRAARALLNISAENLAKKSGVPVTSLRMFELGKTKQLHQKNEDALMSFFAPLVEFIGKRGVAIRLERIRVLEGGDAFLQLLEDMKAQLHSKKGAEALFFSIDPDPSDAVNQAWQKIANVRIKCRYLGRDRNLPSVFDGRIMPEHLAPSTLQAVYGDTVAQRISDEEIVLIHSPLLADSLRQLFEAVWQPAKPLESEDEGDDSDDEPPRKVAGIA